MKLWLRLTLTFIGLALVCLLLNLSQGQLACTSPPRLPARDHG